MWVKKELELGGQLEGNQEVSSCLNRAETQEYLTISV